MEFEALTLCDPVITEWLNSAGLKTEPAGSGFEGVGGLEPSLVQERVGRFLGLRTRWAVLFASYGWIPALCLRRFLVVDDEFISSRGNRFAEGLQFFDGAPITVVNINRTSASQNGAAAFHGILDFEFSPLQESKSDLINRLQLHFAAIGKANDWRLMSVGKALVYAVGSLCVLPGLGQLLAQIAIEVINPSSAWPKGRAGATLGIICASLVAILLCIRNATSAKSRSLQRLIWTLLAWLTLLSSGVVLYLNLFGVLG